MTVTTAFCTFGKILPKAGRLFEAHTERPLAHPPSLGGEADEYLTLVGRVSAALDEAQGLELRVASITLFLMTMSRPKKIREKLLVKPSRHKTAYQSNNIARPCRYVAWSQGRG